MISKSTSESSILFREQYCHRFALIQYGPFKSESASISKKWNGTREIWGKENASVFRVRVITLMAVNDHGPLTIPIFEISSQVIWCSVSPSKSKSRKSSNSFPSVSNEKCDRIHPSVRSIYTSICFPMGWIKRFMLSKIKSISKSFCKMRTCNIFTSIKISNRSS